MLKYIYSKLEYDKDYYFDVKFNGNKAMIKASFSQYSVLGNDVLILVFRIQKPVRFKDFELCIKVDMKKMIKDNYVYEFIPYLSNNVTPDGLEFIKTRIHSEIIDNGGMWLISELHRDDSGYKKVEILTQTIIDYMNENNVGYELNNNAFKVYLYQINPDSYDKYIKFDRDFEITINKVGTLYKFPISSSDKKRYCLTLEAVKKQLVKKLCDF